VRLRAKEVVTLEDAGKSGRNRVEVSLQGNGCGSERLRMIRSLAAQHPGDCQLFLRIRLDGSQTVIATPLQLNPGPSVINNLEEIAGKGAVTLS
jgi:hypothetical protein